MNLKKTAAIAAAAGALAAISVPAMAFENEFHGMYRMFGFMTNALSGAGSFNLAPDSRTDKYFEQRARLQYIAKANDNLKLVTHFELDSKFGGSAYSGGVGAKYPAGDAGALDADRLSLETKDVYLDFNCPLTGANVKAGIQPFSDAMAGNFGNFDATGITFAKKFGAFTGTYGYFTVANSGNGNVFPSNNTSTDLNILDAKIALNKDITVGASYYNVMSKPTSQAAAAEFYAIQNDSTKPGYGTLVATPAKSAVYGSTVVNNTVGLNAAGKFGPASLTAAAALQFGRTIGDINPGKALGTSLGTTAFAANVAAKIAAGPGAVNLAAIYLSGDKDKNDTYNHAWQPIRSDVTYFTPANMWLITRNAATINSSTAIGGTSDLTRGGLGLMGVFAGYAGAAGNVFYDANVGYARVAEKQTANSSSIGTELNATVGYKLYENLKVSATAAYAILGDGYGKENVVLLNGKTVTKSYDNPFMTNIALNYAF